MESDRRDNKTYTNDELNRRVKLSNFSKRTRNIGEKNFQAMMA